MGDGWFAGWGTQVALLASGTPASRIGWEPGPLTEWRRLRHRRLRRRRLCLLAHDPGGGPFGAAQAFWINERSRVWRAVVNDRPGDADLVWVFCQDPLAPPVRRSVEAAVAALPPRVRVLNRPETYDAYHADDCFDRLAAAGVRVPRTRFGDDDVGVTPVVYKARGEQGAGKLLAPYRGPLPGHQAFGFEDGRGPDGLTRRYRAFVVGDAVIPETVLAAADWEARLRTARHIEWTFDPTDHEREQLRLVGAALGMDVFAVDYLRRRTDGLPVVLDVNIYPTVTVGEELTDVTRDRGRWHLFDVPARLGLPWPGGRSAWDVFDEALLRLADDPSSRGTPDSAPPRPGTFAGYEALSRHGRHGRRDGNRRRRRG